MSNTSGIKPVGHRVLVLPELVERKTASGIVLHDAYADREDMAQITAIVIEVGASAWADQAISGAWAKTGDKVMIAKYSGLVLKGNDDKSYRVISDLDVVAVLENSIALDDQPLKDLPDYRSEEQKIGDLYNGVTK